jgi:hypothetical protein
MLIDCDTCIARGPGCGDCVVSVFLGMPPAPGRPEPPVAPLELDQSERDAVAALAAAGLVPPLRLVSGLPTKGRESA